MDRKRSNEYYRAGNSECHIPTTLRRSTVSLILTGYCDTIHSMVHMVEHYTLEDRCLQTRDSKGHLIPKTRQKKTFFFVARLSFFTLYRPTCRFRENVYSERNTANWLEKIPYKGRKLM